MDLQQIKINGKLCGETSMFQKDSHLVSEDILRGSNALLCINNDINY